MEKESGKIIFVSVPRTGVSSRSGESWATQTIVIETNERYPRKLALEVFGQEKIETASFKPGDVVDVMYYAVSHEFNGVWYTELRMVDALQNNLSRFVKGII